MLVSKGGGDALRNLQHLTDPSQVPERQECRPKVDDRSWAVRYLVVDAGDWLPGHRVLVSPISLRRSEPTTLHVAFSRQQVTTKPGSTVTRAVPVSSTALGVEPAILTCEGEGGDLQLQSATGVLGYAIQAEDGEIGHVNDVLVDDEAWAVRYLVVDTRHWWSDKKVLVSPEWLTRVTWDESKTLFCLVTAVDDGTARGRSRWTRTKMEIGDDRRGGG
jgi:hypothetical protein